MKAPGQLKEARKRHLAAQARVDALRRLKAGEVVKVSALTEDGPKTVVVRPLAENEPMIGQRVLCIFGRKLHAMWYSDDDVDPGRARVIDRYHNGVIPAGRIRGAVVEDEGEIEHDR